jgi:hypothetical protein
VPFNQSASPIAIHSDQTGFMRGRYIGDNIRNILEIIETVEEEDLSCIILSVDFEKALDLLSWKFLQQCLDYFKFGPSFKKWTSILFQNISSCVLNTGWSTEFFSVERGVRQGCPTSPYLFIITAEILGIAIRRSDDVKGFKYKN